MDELTLLNRLNSLELSWGSLDRWLKFWILLVVIGVSVELVVICIEYRHELHDFGRGIIHAPDRPSGWLLFCALLGAGLVAIGVAGEFFIHIKAGRVESEMRDVTARLVALADERAERANEKAEAEHLARVQLEKSMEWRHLTESQKQAVCSVFSPAGANQSSILSAPEDPEAWSYANEFAEQITSCAVSGGFARGGHLGRIAWSSTIFGVWVRFSRSPSPSVPLAKRRALATSLAKKLSEIGVKIEGISNEEPAGIVFPYLYVGPRFPPHAERLINIPASKGTR